MEFFDVSEASQAKKLIFYFHISMDGFFFFPLRMILIICLPLMIYFLVYVRLQTSFWLMTSKLSADMPLSVTENQKLEGTLSIP